MDQIEQNSRLHFDWEVNNLDYEQQTKIFNHLLASWSNRLNPLKYREDKATEVESENTGEWMLLKEEATQVAAKARIP